MVKGRNITDYVKSAIPLCRRRIDRVIHPLQFFNIMLYGRVAFYLFGKFLF